MHRSQLKVSTLFKQENKLKRAHHAVLFHSLKCWFQVITSMYKNVWTLWFSIDAKRSKPWTTMKDFKETDHNRQKKYRRSIWKWRVEHFEITKRNDWYKRYVNHYKFLFTVAHGTERLSIKSTTKCKTVVLYCLQKWKYKNTLKEPQSQLYGYSKDHLNKYCVIL